MSTADSTYLSYSSLAYGLAVGYNDSVNIYDLQQIILSPASVSSLAGVIQHITKLNFAIGPTLLGATSPDSAFILQLSSSDAKVNGTLTCTGNLTCNKTITAGTISLYTLTGATTPGVIQHATGLLFCIGSTNPVTAAADKLMALDKSSGLSVNTNACVFGTFEATGNTYLDSTLTCTGAATFSSSINGGNAVLSSNLTSVASPSGTTTTTSHGLYTKNPNATHSASYTSLGFYTDTTNGSNPGVYMNATEVSGVNSRLGQVYMQYPTGLVFSVPSGVGYKYYIGSAVPLAIESNSNVFFLMEPLPLKYVLGEHLQVIIYKLIVILQIAVLKPIQQPVIVHYIFLVVQQDDIK
jgi:hypothetical protein